jgi:GNAT superfamily N-acetyltransferase
MEAMTEILQIRRTTIQDARDLHANCFSMSSFEAVKNALIVDLAAMETGQRIRLVASINGVVVGNATLFREQHVLKQHIGSIHDVVVCGLYQGRGIARRLFEQISEEARAMSLHILDTSARAGMDADQVYRKLGFREYGRLPGGLREPWGEQQFYDHVFFWKPIE